MSAMPVFCGTGDPVFCSEPQFKHVKNGCQNKLNYYELELGDDRLWGEKKPELYFFSLRSDFCCLWEFALQTTEQKHVRQPAGFPYKQAQRCLCSVSLTRTQPVKNTRPKKWDTCFFFSVKYCQSWCQICILVPTSSPLLHDILLHHHHQCVD